MAEQYTPSTEEMRAFYVAERLDGPHLSGFPEPTVSQGEAEFDRWLAARDAKVLAEHLRSLSAKYGGFAARADYDHMPTTRGVFRTIATLLAEEALHQAPEADRIAGDPDA